MFYKCKRCGYPFKSPLQLRLHRCEPPNEPAYVPQPSPDNPFSDGQQDQGGFDVLTTSGDSNEN